VDIYSRKKRSELMSKVRTFGTTPEMVIRRKLHSLGFRFRLNSKKLPGKPDIVLPKYHSIIFVHGCFWHHHEGCPKSKLPTSNAEFWSNKISANVRRDEKNICDLECLGWRTLIVWECETKNGTYISKITDYLGEENLKKTIRMSV
jgi:DNA mismatch endonuclease (patch repair protein)